MALALGPWKTQLDPEWVHRIDAMAEELSRLSAHLAAAEYRWLRLLAEFDEAGGWAQQGARTCAAWLSWACGISPGTAREKVRVAQALPALPRVCESFAAGRLSYSKVRAITRVATPENEELLVQYGESATAAQLERVLRGYRHVHRLEEARDAALQHEQRYLRTWIDDEGYLRIDARYPVDDGALIVAQIERLAESGAEPDSPPPAKPSSHVSAETAESGRGDAPVLSPGWAASDPIEARRADALRTMAETAAAHGPTACVGGDTHLVVVHACRDELRDPATAADADVPDPATSVATAIAGVGSVSAETARRLGCDASVVTLVEDGQGRPLGVGRQSKTVPRWRRRALTRRDRGRCQFPNCTATKFLDAHHIVHWADDGSTDLDNVLLLCRFHHRLVHEVGYRIVGTGNNGVTFERLDGSVVPATIPAPPGDPDAVERDNAQRRLEINELTPIPNWDGTPPDYSLAVGLLLDRDVSAETPRTRAAAVPVLDPVA